jgi:hypothetical protein
MSTLLATQTMNSHLQDYVGKQVQSIRNPDKIGVVEKVKLDKGLVTVRLKDGSSKDFYPNNLLIIGDGGSIVSTMPTMRLERNDEPTQPQVMTTNFTITQKFEFMEQLVRMVIKAISVSVVITGPGGLGKSFMVMEQLQQAGLEEEVDYVIIKGYSTAKGLYRSLFQHNGKLIIYDDTDEILKNDVAKNILKSALDSYDVRKITWNSEAKTDLPDSFEFSGRVIFVSNLSQDRIDQALLSRSLTIDISMNQDEKIQRMRDLAPFMLKDLTLEFKSECIDFIEGFKNICNDLNMRTLIKVCKVRQLGENGWKELAEFILLSQ